MNLIRKSWESYDRDVVPKDASDSQRLEVRRAFFAGAVAMQTINNVIAQPELPEAVGMKMLSAVQAELDDFKVGIGRGN